MQKLTITFLCMLFFIPVCFGKPNHVVLSVPEIIISAPNNQALQVAKGQFIQQLQETVLPINQQYNGPILGFAPFGASKITAFKELNLDGLVIIDWDRTGSPTAIEKTFEDESLRRLLIRALEEAFVGGCMSSSTIMETAVSAQILARFWLELEVSSVRVQFYLPKNVTLPAPGLQLWDGPIMEDRDVPLITRFLFNYHNQPKELVYISSKVTSDSVTWRESLPVKLMQSLAPNKFHWGYLSADYVGFFSKKHDNGLNKANQEFLDLLADGAGIILDYPYYGAYTSCRGPFDGMTLMCGREALEHWGLKLVKNMQHLSYVFGYIGLTSQDEVRIYVKPHHTNKPVFTKGREIFSLDDFIQIGDEYEFELKGS